jgi:hypothetical protein
VASQLRTDAAALESQLAAVTQQLENADASATSAETSQRRLQAKCDAFLRHFSSVLVMLAADIGTPSDIIDGLLSTDSDLFSASIKRYARFIQYASV